MDKAVLDRGQETLERLLEIPDADLPTALSHASDVIALTFAADKVDVFVYDATRDALVALGTSEQPLSERALRHGLDVLPVSNGGRVVQVYETGSSFTTGRLDQDTEELRGVKEALEIRFLLGVPLRVAGSVRGVLMIASQKASLFTSEHARLAENVARWVGVLAHRAELMRELARDAVEQGRRTVADELIGVLAHDLRNYIAPVELRLTLVRRRIDASGREQDSRDLGLALDGLRRLGARIADRVDVARIDQGVLRLELARLDVVALLNETANERSTPDRLVEVHASEEMVVTGDRARLRQCVDNVIANAVQHSPMGGCVTVRVALEAGLDECWARIEIIDQGPGIPEELLASIFQPFVTGKGAQGGLGLGLHLAQQIARMHGGDLTVESEQGRGTRFVLTLPGAQPSAPP